MKIWSYDIWDGDKGIIFAKTKKDAKRIFKSNYDNKISDTNCDSGICQLEEIGEYNGGEAIMYLYN